MLKKASQMLAASLTGTLFGIACMAPVGAHAENTTSSIALGSNGSLSLTIDGKALCALVPTAANPQWQFSEGIKTGRSKEGNPQFGLSASGPIQGEASLTPKKPSADVAWRFSSRDAVSFNTLAVATKLSLGDFIGGTWKTDLAEGRFPDTFEKEAIYGGAVSTLSVTAVDGRSFTVTFPSPTHIGIQDDRRWGGRSYTIRIGQVFGKLASGETYLLPLTIELPGETTYSNDEEVVILPGQDWVPLTPFLDIVPGSALDLSVINSTDGECGSKGRVIATPDGHFAFANEPTAPQRFYGANLCFSSQYMSKEKVDILLDRWVRMGYNTLRIHHYEFGLTTPIWKTGFDWNNQNLDQLSYLIAGCSKRGIWLTTDLYVSRPIAPAQIGVPATKPYMNDNGLVDVQMYKALLLVHEPAYEDFKKFTAQLMNHVNPYTGKRLADEPALAWINLINEGAPGDRVKSLPPWKTAWNAWLAKRYTTRPLLAVAVGNLKESEDAKSGTVEFPEESVLADTPRGRLCQVFLAEMEQSFVARTRSFLRDELKCQALLSNHNCGPNTVPDLGIREDFDYVDDHFYVDHPIFEKGWGLPSRSPNESPVRDGAPRATGSASLRLWGKPMTISEFNFSGPGRYRGVGALMTGALASLQDWDVLWRFAYAHSDKEIFTPSPIDYFNIVRDPLSLAADRAAVMLFLRGDLKTSPSRVAYSLTNRDLEEATAQSKAYIPEGLAWTTRLGISAKTTPPGSIPIPFASDKATVIAKLTAAGVKVDSGVVQSETGELSLDRARGVLTVDTVLTAGGYADEGQSIQTKQSGVSIREVKTGATLFVTSLDGKPIRNSARLLVTHLTDLQNTGAHYGESARQTLLSWGGLPYLVRDGRATISIPLANPSAYQVWELSVAGHRLERIPAVVENGTLCFTATVRGNYGARMLYEVTTEAGQPDPVIKTIKADIEATKTAMQLKNGAMSDGDDVPKEWGLKFDIGELKMVRDTSVFASAPASLRLESVGGKAKGLASQRVNVTSGEKIKVTAKVKAEGTLGHAALVMLAIGGTPNWNELARIKNSTEWETVSTDFTVPTGTQFCLLLLFMDGDGKVWMDDASVQAAGSVAPAPAAAATDSPALPVRIGSADALIRTIGRFDRNGEHPRSAWPGSAIEVRFIGSAINVLVRSSANGLPHKDGGLSTDYLNAVVDDGKPLVLALEKGRQVYRVGDGLSEGEHILRLSKRTESFIGTVEWMGVQLAEGGKLLPPVRKPRQIEFIGDSITCGYGNEAPNAQAKFSPHTENFDSSYAGLTARALNADAVAIAWSGIGVYSSRGDTQNTLLTRYDKILPWEAGSIWDFASWTPELVVINLGTNDFAKEDPGEAYVDHYVRLLRRIRGYYPNAAIFCTLGPMLGGKTLSRCREDIQSAMAAADDANLHFLEFPGQNTALHGVGADWHPSLKTHALMSDKLVAAIREQIGWK